MKSYKRETLSRYILATLTMGLFSIAPLAYALPVQDTGHANTPGSSINASVANQLGITSTKTNNVMNWKSFSIANGESVAFDTNNYLNLVRGASKSEINGVLSGGGSIYLINPNGILFGSNASVNVGNLVASTRAISDVNSSDFENNGTNPLATAATAAAGDIVNMGKLQTASVVLEGNNITIQNAADIIGKDETPLTGAVTVKAAGNITVGHSLGKNTIERIFNDTSQQVHNYATDTYLGSGYITSKLDGTTVNTVTEAMLVENIYDLQHMDANLNGNYMLAGDIAASDSANWNSGAGFSPVGDSTNKFTGTFDGVNHTINGLYINRPETDYVGLFGHTDAESTIQNIGLLGSSITGGGSVGGVVGNNSGSITNVYNTGTVSGIIDVGGVVGNNNSKGIITNVYNTGAVNGTIEDGKNVGGVVGYSDGAITNAYNTGAVSSKGVIVGGVAGRNNGDLTNVYNTGAVSGNLEVGGVVGNNDGSIINAVWANDLSYTPTSGSKPNRAVGNQDDTDMVKGSTLNDMKKADTYSSWQGDNGRMVATTGNAGKTWRIYEGNTTPLLTSFFKGVAAVDNATTSTAEYNGQEQTVDVSKLSFDPALADTSHIFSVGGGRNVGTYSFNLYSDQQGYDLVDSGAHSLTITPKTLTATLTGDNVFTKVYDGTTAVSQALTLGTNYTLDGIVADSDKVNLSGSGAYNDKNAGDNKTVTFSGLTLTGTGAGNYTIASTLSGAVGRITKKSLVAEMNNGASFTKVYDGTTAVNTALVLDGNYAFAEGDVVTGDIVSIDAAKAVGTYADKNAGSNKAVNFTNLTLTGTDAGNYELFDMEMGINGASITPKTLTAAITGDNVFTKVYDGTTAVSQALGTNYILDGIVADSDKVSLSAGSGAYNNKDAGDNKTVTFSGLTLTGTGAGNYTIANTLSGAVGQITRKTITGALTSGYSFDKVYDGTTTATLGSGYTLNGVVAGDKVPLTAAKGFYDSSAIGDRTVTFSGFSINDGNYLLSMADSLSGTGKITSGSQDHNYSDALVGFGSFFDTNPADGMTIFRSNPEDYIPRAVTKNNGQSYQVGVAQVTQTWYNGPASLTIVNGGITLPKDILLGSTQDTRIVVIKGSNSYQI